MNELTEIHISLLHVFFYTNKQHTYVSERTVVISHTMLFDITEHYFKKVE